MTTCKITRRLSSQAHSRQSACSSSGFIANCTDLMKLFISHITHAHPHECSPQPSILVHCIIPKCTHRYSKCFFPSYFPPKCCTHSSCLSCVPHALQAYIFRNVKPQNRSFIHITSRMLNTRFTAVWTARWTQVPSNPIIRPSIRFFRIGGFWYSKILIQKFLWWHKCKVVQIILLK